MISRKGTGFFGDKKGDLELQELNDTRDDLQKQARSMLEDLKEAERQQTNAIAQLNLDKQVTAKLRGGNTELRAQAAELVNEAAAIAQETAEVDAARGADTVRCARLRTQLERLREKSAALQTAFSCLPATSSDSKHPNSGALVPPLVDVTEEAHTLWVNASTGFEKELDEIRLKTASCSDEQRVFDQECDVIAPEIAKLRTNHEVLAGMKKRTEEQAKVLETDLVNLEKQKIILQNQIKATTCAKQVLEEHCNDMQEKLTSHRTKVEAVRAMAWKEVQEARDKCSKTNLVKQRAALESDTRQKELMSLVTAHSQAKARSSSQDFPTTCGIPDVDPVSLKMALQRAQHPAHHCPQLPRPLTQIERRTIAG